MLRVSILSLFIFAFISCSSAALVQQTWTVEEWVVDFMRPTVDLRGFFPWEWPAERVSPYAMAEDQRKNAYLINGQYPGPAVECYEGDTVEINVFNNLLSEVLSIHWHGQHQPGTPWMDGAHGITQQPILPGQNFTYRFIASPAGSHYYHAHMDAVQTAKGIKGAFIVKQKDDPFLSMYDEDVTVVVSDEWRQPEVCLKLEGAMPGNDVCADVRQASFNGQYGNGSDAYPFPLVVVEQGKCYRMRFIFPGSNTENFKITITGHNMTLIATDGYPVKPIMVTSFNMHLGERYDIVLCANQDPGYYLINATYDYACTLTPGHFIPPGFSAVPSCMFYGFLYYKGYEGFIPSDPTGGSQGQPTAGVDFDLTDFDSWNLTEPLNPEPEPEEPDVRFVINMGLLGPTYGGPTDRPLAHGRWYMDIDTGNEPRSWKRPSSPLYMTKGTCGTSDIPMVHIPENATTIEFVINNLSPTAHVLHMHGAPFKVINYANFEWCSIDRITCFFMPWWLNYCPSENVQVGDPANPELMLGTYWGCKYNPQTDPATQNLQTPLVKDMLQVWQRSWAVIRFKATNPGWWMFHCHMEQHIPLGMQMVLNILPSQQPPVPPEVPNWGSCTPTNNNNANPIISN